jgi:hypothetical protein
MIPKAGYGLAGLLVLAATTGMGFAQSLPLAEQPLASPQKTDPWAIEGAEAPAKETEANANPDESKSDSTKSDDTDIADLELDWSQLDVDASTLMTTSPASKARVTSRNAATGEVTWSSKDTPNGSAVSVKQPVSPFWDTRIGADMTIVRPPATLSELLAEKATNGGNEPQSSGTAWAAVTAPGVASIWDKTTVEARVDPSQDQGKLGTSLSKSLKLGEQYSLTLQNGYNMIQGLAPAPGTVGHTTYATEQSAKLGISDTGTSFSAGQTLSSGEDKWLRKIGAEQKIVGGFNISGSVAETALGPSNKSITAGFKQSW